MPVQAHGSAMGFANLSKSRWKFLVSSDRCQQRYLMDIMRPWRGQANRRTRNRRRLKPKAIRQKQNHPKQLLKPKRFRLQRRLRQSRSRLIWSPRRRPNHRCRFIDRHQRIAPHPAGRHLHHRSRCLPRHPTRRPPLHRRSARFPKHKTLQIPSHPPCGHEPKKFPVSPKPRP